ncbi:hypothetical protein ACJX0J_031036, partial [Zea mays]
MRFQQETYHYMTNFGVGSSVTSTSTLVACMHHTFYGKNIDLPYDDDGDTLVKDDGVIMLAMCLEFLFLESWIIICLLLYAMPQNEVIHRYGFYINLDSLFHGTLENLIFISSLYKSIYIIFIPTVALSLLATKLPKAMGPYRALGWAHPAESEC